MIFLLIIAASLLFSAAILVTYERWRERQHWARMRTLIQLRLFDESRT